MLGKLREKYQIFMTPFGKILARTGLTPNIITVISLLTSFFSYFAYYNKRPIVGVILIIITGIVDMFDGAVARAIQKTSRFGATLDHVIDRYAEFLIIIGIIQGGYANWLLGVFSLFGMLMASFTRAKAESVGGLSSCTVGIAERQEKLLLIIIGSIIAPIFPKMQIMNYSILAAGLLSHITVIQRLHFTWKRTGDT
jgi:CDP-diacylglycerol--glycerol-3-phosphate 3-phosphatidyltransferase/archaetidylinositol phosphate synthase